MDSKNSFMHEYTFNKINPNKLTFSFTWDDNFEAHARWIAPIFESYHKRCTFFVNPGEPDYLEYLGKEYDHLAELGFEIGSHGYTHHHFSSLSDMAYVYQLKKSKDVILETTGITPIVFAFPHHDFTTQMLNKAKEFYFETRNTLHNAPRFSLKSNTTLKNIQKAINTTIINKQSLVFSGHSISLNKDAQNADGYEPLPLGILDKTLRILSDYETVSEICTFGQAALKEYIRCNCNFTDKSFYINSNQLTYLEQFGLTSERIEELT